MSIRDPALSDPKGSWIQVRKRPRVPPFRQQLIAPLFPRRPASMSAPPSRPNVVWRQKTLSGLVLRDEGSIEEGKGKGHRDGMVQQSLHEFFVKKNVGAE